MTIILRSRWRKLCLVTAIASSSLLLYGCSDGDDDDLEATDGSGNMQETNGGDDGDDDAVQETVLDNGTSQFVVPLSAELAIPPLDLPDAVGEANFNIGKTSGVISGSVSVSGLTSAVTAAHIHLGFAGQPGTPLIELTSNTDGSLLSIPTTARLDAAMQSALNAGELYINVRTANNPTGEIRGQIVPQDILLEDTELSGLEAVPAISTEASGFGFSTLDEASGLLNVTIFTTDVISATVANIHTGVVGETGPQILSLVQDTADNSIWRTQVGAQLTTEQVEAFKDEALYVNIHSNAYPDGEIRGQL